MVIANVTYGRKNIEAKIDTLDAELKATQAGIIKGAECTMKAIKGDPKPLERFLEKQRYWDCMRSPQDCESISG